MVLDGSSVHKCLYNNQVLQPGFFTPVPCVRCLCEASSGSINCSYLSCPKLEADCLKVIKDESKCCNQCAEYGCSFNGSVFAIGDIISQESCQICRCSESSQVECNRVTCSENDCVEGDFTNTPCCPNCEDYKRSVCMFLLGSLMTGIANVTVRFLFSTRFLCTPMWAIILQKTYAYVIVEHRPLEVNSNS